MYRRRLLCANFQFSLARSAQIVSRIVKIFLQSFVFDEVGGS